MPQDIDPETIVAHVLRDKLADCARCDQLKRHGRDRGGDVLYNLPVVLQSLAWLVADIIHIRGSEDGRTELGMFFDTRLINRLHSLEKMKGNRT